MHYIILLWHRRIPKITSTNQTNKLLGPTSIHSYWLSLSWVRQTHVGEIDKVGWLAWFVKRVMCAVSSSPLVYILSV